MKTVSFYWRFDADNGQGRQLRAEVAKQQGWPDWYEKAGGSMYLLGTTRLAPEWVQEAMIKALSSPEFRDWRPRGYLKDGYWAGMDQQQSPKVEICA
jgi:hypothetical protein